MTRGVDSSEKTLLPLLAMNANSHGTAKRGEKTSLTIYCYIHV